MFVKLAVIVFLFCTVQANDRPTPLTRNNNNNQKNKQPDNAKKEPDIQKLKTNVASSRQTPLAQKSNSKGNTQPDKANHEPKIEEQKTNLTANSQHTHLNVSSNHKGNKYDLKHNLFTAGIESFHNWTEATKNILLSRYLQRTGGSSSCDGSYPKCDCVQEEMKTCGATFKSCAKIVWEILEESKNCGNNSGIYKVERCIMNLFGVYANLYNHVKENKCLEAYYAYKYANSVFKDCKGKINGLDDTTKNAIFENGKQCYSQLQSNWEDVQKKYISCNQPSSETSKKSTSNESV